MISNKSSSKISSNTNNKMMIMMEKNKIHIIVKMIMRAKLTIVVTAMWLQLRKV